LTQVPLASEYIDVEALQRLAIPAGEAEFEPHMCWRMIFIYPHTDHPDEPGEARCQGCGRSWRMEEEFTP
jgi:hypothetical protein